MNDRPSDTPPPRGNRFDRAPARPQTRPNNAGPGAPGAGGPNRDTPRPNWQGDQGYGATAPGRGGDRPTGDRGPPRGPSTPGRYTGSRPAPNRGPGRGDTEQGHYVPTNPEAFQGVGADGRPRRSGAIDHRPSAGEPPRDAIVGLHAALAILQFAPKRVTDVYLWNDDSRVVARVQEAAERGGVRVQFQRPVWASGDAREGSAQGVALRVTPFQYEDLDDIVPVEGAPDGTLLVCLDSITDPRNLGAILRSAAFFGATAVILPQDRSAEVTPLVERVAEGGSVAVPVIQVVNLARTLQQLQDRGVEVVGTALDHVSGDLRDHRFGRATALVFGSEGDGMRPLVRKRCDVVVHSRSATDAVQSLNVSAFATLALGLARAQMDAAAAPKAPAAGGHRNRGT